MLHLWYSQTSESDGISKLEPYHVTALFYSSNLFNNLSPVISYQVDLAISAAVEIRGWVLILSQPLSWFEASAPCTVSIHSCLFLIQFRVSSPDHIFLPIPNWQPKENPETEDDIGPLVQHIYEVCWWSEQQIVIIDPEDTECFFFSPLLLVVSWPDNPVGALLISKVKAKYLLQALFYSCFL